MTKGTVLIVVKDKNNIAEDIKKKTQFKIDILETIINKERIKEFNEKANVEYDYIIFYEKINYSRFGITMCMYDNTGRMFFCS